MTGNPLLLVIVAGIMFAVLGGVTLLSHIYSLNGIKSKTVGDGQHGTARWATRKEIKQTYKHIPFTPKRWREQAKSGIIPTVAYAVKRKKKKGKAVEEQALPQGIIVGCEGNTTALVDTGSKMDDVVFEEFKGTGNMELHLDRKLSEKRIFPAINLNKSGTRREDLLMTQEELEAVWIMRRAMANLGTQEATERIVDQMAHTKNNEDFIQIMKKIGLEDTNGLK